MSQHSWICPDCGVEREYLANLINSCGICGSGATPIVVGPYKPRGRAWFPPIPARFVLGSALLLSAIIQVDRFTSRPKSPQSSAELYETVVISTSPAPLSVTGAATFMSSATMRNSVMETSKMVLYPHEGMVFASGADETFCSFDGERLLCRTITRRWFDNPASQE